MSCAIDPVERSLERLVDARQADEARPEKSAEESRKAGIALPRERLVRNRAQVALKS